MDFSRWTKKKLPRYLNHLSTRTSLWTCSGRWDRRRWVSEGSVNKCQSFIEKLSRNTLKGNHLRRRGKRYVRLMSTDGRHSLHRLTQASRGNWRASMLLLPCLLTSAQTSVKRMLYERRVCASNEIFMPANSAIPETHKFLRFFIFNTFIPHEESRDLLANRKQ